MFPADFFCPFAPVIILNKKVIGYQDVLDFRFFFFFQTFNELGFRSIEILVLNLIIITMVRKWHLKRQIVFSSPL